MLSLSLHVPYNFHLSFRFSPAHLDSVILLQKYIVVVDRHRYLVCVRVGRKETQRKSKEMIDK